MLSNSSKYALKALHYLYLNASEKEKMNAMDLSGATGIPKAFLSKLLKELSSQNLVSSTKGPNGGFFLNEAQIHQPILDIIKLLDGHDHFTKCVLGFINCNAEKPCPIHALIIEEKDAFNKKMYSLRISDLSADLSYLD